MFKATLNDNTIKLSEISDRIVNKNEGVILKSSSSNFLMTASDNGTTSVGGYENNSLQPAITTITNPVNAYVLNKTDENGVGFYKLSANGIIAAGKAYLTYSGTFARQFFLFDEATGIDVVDSGQWIVPAMRGTRLTGGSSTESPRRRVCIL